MTVLSEKFLSFFGRVTHCVALSMLLASCGIKSEISTTTVGASLAGVTVSKIRPIEAKPSDLLTIEGSNFSASKDLRARVSLEDGSTKDVPLKVIDRTKGTFVMPEGAGLGLKSVSIFQGGSKQVASLGIVANTAENQLPILITEQSAVCSDTQYIDRNGDQQTGTKDCAAGTTLPPCSTDGGSNCVVDGTIYLAAAKATATAANIKSGVIIAGVLGTATLESHSNCNSNGQQSCVAADSYFAGTACAADGFNCFLPSYSVTDFQTKKAVDVSTIDSTKMLDTLIVSGITGNVASRGSWNLTTAFPGEGFFTGVSNSPTAATIAKETTITGVKGTATLTPANCASDGAIGCVTVAGFKSADMSVAIAGNIKSGETVAGVAGQYPSPTYTLTGATGTADLDLATFDAKIKSSTFFEWFGPDGMPYSRRGADTITEANIANGVSIFGTTGTLSGSGLVAPDPWNVRVGVTVNGVTGKLKVNCRNRANLTLQDMDIGRSVSGIASNVLTTTLAHELASNQAVRLHYSGVPSGVNNYTTYYVISASATTFQLSMTSGPGAAMSISGGAGITVHKWLDGTADIWDTIDDYNNFTSGLPGSVISGWTNNDCGGIDTPGLSSDDDNVWKDVTTSNGVTASTCTAGTSTNCTMQDKITGLWWSKLQGSAAWNVALTTCSTTLNATTPYAGNSVAGYNGQTGWRLPTQKELLEGYTHGIRSAGTANWMFDSNMNSFFWSASSTAGSGDNSKYALVMNLASGSSGINNKSNPYQVVCVR